MITKDDIQIELFNITPESTIHIKFLKPFESQLMATIIKNVLDTIKETYGFMPKCLFSSNENNEYEILNKEEFERFIENLGYVKKNS